MVNQNKVVFCILIMYFDVWAEKQLIKDWLDRLNKV